MTRLFAAARIAVPVAASAQGSVIDRAVREHILPGYARAAAEAQDPAAVAQAEGAPDRETLRAAYQEAFDARLGVAQVQSGPALADNRLFAMGFRPDPRGVGSPSATTDAARCTCQPPASA